MDPDQVRERDFLKDISRITEALEQIVSKLGDITDYS
jgi:hypothetical protein